jgi:hypothetical protein
MRTKIWLTVCGAAVAVAAGGGAVLAATTGAQQPPPNPSPPAAPATDPRVQQWFKDRDALEIQLNDTLLAVQRFTGPSGAARSACARLDRVTGQLLGGPHSPAGALDVPVNAGIAQFAQAAQMCLHGDFPGMRKLLDDGAAQRANAQDAIDEILDGDADAH